jgi:predicted translin family RNA/ssDNA-binding protein
MSCLLLTGVDIFIQSKESKLVSDFVQKAPAAVVEKERQSLEECCKQCQSANKALESLKRFLESVDYVNVFVHTPRSFATLLYVFLYSFVMLPL